MVLVAGLVASGCGPRVVVLHNHAGERTQCGQRGAVLSLNPVVMIVGTAIAGAGLHGTQAICIDNAAARGFVPLDQTPPTAEAVEQRRQAAAAETAAREAAARDLAPDAGDIGRPPPIN